VDDATAPRPGADAALVRRLVAAQFPEWAHLPVRPVERDGWDNRTFRLGDQLAVRLPSAVAYAAQAEKEHRFLPRLAPHLPLEVPVSLALGEPAEGFPWRWSVRRWIDGEDAAVARIGDAREFANSLAVFLVALQRIDVEGGSPPGPDNFFRGGPLATYEGETRAALAALRGRIDVAAAAGVWDAALAAS
jgi:aminoglycoside phosphotransferase (APT) family kinase protein